MTRRPRHEKRILAIDPASRGFGFAVLEGPTRLIDWGVKEARDRKKTRALRQIADLLTQYRPDAIVLEKCGGRGCRRSVRVQELIGAIGELARTRRIKTHYCFRTAMRGAFSESSAITKHQIAAAIIRRLPELKEKLPPPRHPWATEHSAMPVFDAVALGLTYFHARNPREKTHH